MKRVLSLVAAAVMVASVFAGNAEAAGRGPGSGRRIQARQVHRHDGYFRGRDVVVIREYHRPYARPLPPGLQRKYSRSGYLPPGWARRVRPVPAYIERDMLPVPRGYRRGVVDGRAVVYDRRGFILDVAVLF